MLRVMGDVTPRRRRLTQVAAQEVEAARLLSIATHSTARAQVRLASRDLDEALLWLKETDVDARPSILKMVDLLLDLATCRLTMVDSNLKTYGPGARLIG
jgi:hypothetical protein